MMAKVVPYVEPTMPGALTPKYSLDPMDFACLAITCGQFARPSGFDDHQAISTRINASLVCAGELNQHPSPESRWLRLSP